MLQEEWKLQRIKDETPECEPTSYVPVFDAAYFLYWTQTLVPTNTISSIKRLLWQKTIDFGGKK